MKVRVVFGLRGGPKESFECNSPEQAAELAQKLALVFDPSVFDRKDGNAVDFLVRKGQPSSSWSSSTHCIYVELLYDTDEDLAAAWKNLLRFFKK